MDYGEIVSVYENIEATTKRLEMTDHLTELFKKVPMEIIDKVIYLTQGKIAPDFAGKEFGLAGKLVIKALSFTSGINGKEIERSYLEKGDMGLVAQEAIERKKQRSLFETPLTVERVFENFSKIAAAAGSGSQELKMKLLAELLHDSKPREAKYIVRTVLGSMRLGIADMTIIDALAQAFAEKELRDEVERAYNLQSDLGKVGKILATEGMQALRRIGLKTGTPVRAMLAERLPSLEEIFEKLGKCAFEYKYDGLRIQAHVDKEVFLFSRRLENITKQFPEIIAALKSKFKGKTAIVEGECVPVDISTGEFLPFQEVSHRRGRIHGLREAAEEYPVHLFLFDCLLLDGEDLTKEPLQRRREVLEGCVQEGDPIHLSKFFVTDDVKEAERFFDESLAAGCEGLVAKSLISGYHAGARGWNWIKYKREYKSEMTDTVDLVVVGAFAGRGRRAGTYGALLMAAYDQKDDMFKTICKLGTGFDDATLASLPDMLSKFKTEAKHLKVDSKMDADYWFEPEVVLEVLGAEITVSPSHTAGMDMIKEGAGLAIRFPRFTGRWRDDKEPRDATTVEELVSMYKEQLKVIS